MWYIILQTLVVVIFVFAYGLQDYYDTSTTVEKLRGLIIM